MGENMDMLNPLMRFQTSTSCSLDLEQQYKYKQTKENLQMHFHPKDHTLSQTKGSVGWACVHLSFYLGETLNRTFYRCFLPNFGSFSYSVSEEKIFLEINHSETRIACGGHVC